jgi:hypothetical protein
VAAWAAVTPKAAVAAKNTAQIRRQQFIGFSSLN